MMELKRLLQACALAALVQNVAGFYLPGVAPQTYAPNEAVEVKVNRLTSAKTQLAYDYYDLPFCRPSEGVQNAAENLGEILTGNKIENSAYKVNMNQEVACQVLCKMDYTAEQVALFKKKIDEEYAINFLVDNLPAATHVPVPGSASTFLAYDRGFRVGGTIRITGSGSDKPPMYYLNNHVRLTIFYHQPSAESDGARVVGFEVEPFSINHLANVKGGKFDEKATNLCDKDKPLVHKFEDNYPQKIGMDKISTVVFTYDVIWKSSSTKWASRWDVYLQAGTAETAEVHWFSIINSVLIVFFLSGMVAMILVRTLHKDLTRYNRVPTDEEKAEELEETGWKLVHGDVFRPPPMPMLFSVTVGNGVQVLGMSVVTLFFAAIGFLSPANRGALMIALLLLFVFMGVFSGYAASRTYKMFAGKQWQRVTLLTAFLMPGTVFLILFILNLVVWAEGSTTAIPFPSMLAVLALWFGVSVPLTFLGAYFGFRRDVDKLPVQTLDIPRQIPSQPWYMSSIITVLVGGILPFGAVFVELFFILSTLWLDSFYYVYGFLVLVFLILVITCAEISVVLCYFQLCGEDYRWWWRSMFTSGSSAFYVFLYSLHWYTLKLSATRFVTHVLFFGYMSVLSLFFFLATAIIGYYASLWFVIKIFSSVKVD